MHELSIAENLLSVTLRYANDNHAVRVSDLHVIIGDLASVEALTFHWENISRGTIAEGAQLQFELIPTTLYCLTCGQRYACQLDGHGPHSHDYECAICHSKSVEITGGETFRLDAIEIITADASEAPIVEETGLEQERLTSLI
jgi:hydrogenase nickel incorporation protein HypA/HybF